jgi:hypothetical protein
VPIFTSEIAKLLEPEFKFVHAVKPLKHSSLHYADLTDGENTIRVYNSYDRKLALRVTLYVDGMPVDLGAERLIHIGSKAKTFVDDLQEHKKNILDSIENAKTLHNVLNTTPITKELAGKIKEIIYRNYIKKDGFQSLENYADMLIEKNISVTSFIKASIVNFEKGNFTYVINGEKHTGRKQNSTFGKIEIEAKIMELIQEEFIEFLF